MVVIYITLINFLLYLTIVGLEIQNFTYTFVEFMEATSKLHYIEALSF